MLARKLVRPDGIVEYRAGGRLHRDDGPAMVLPNGHQKWYQFGLMHRERLATGEWRHYRNGKLHRADGPAIDGPLQECWFLDGREHREQGPAQRLKSTGVLIWWREGRMHRADGPAVTRPDGAELWYQNGSMHRVGHPAARAADGAQDWYLNGLLHRDDGPAMLRPNGHEVWFRKGRIQRGDGPAIVMPDGRAFFTRGGFVLAADGRPVEPAAILALLPDPVSVFSSVTARSIEGKAFRLPPPAPFVAARNGARVPAAVAADRAGGLRSPAASQRRKTLARPGNHGVP